MHLLSVIIISLLIITVYNYHRYDTIDFLLAGSLPLFELTSCGSIVLLTLEKLSCELVFAA